VEWARCNSSKDAGHLSGLRLPEDIPLFKNFSDPLVWSWDAHGTHFFFKKPLSMERPEPA
jgi:hypothetical protein